VPAAPTTMDVIISSHLKSNQLKHIHNAKLDRMKENEDNFQSKRSDEMK
jgi:hypothetical protein